MIVGIGIDLQDITEFRRTLDRAGEPYLNRVFTRQELDHCRSLVEPHQSLAVRFAAKEATMKALGIVGEPGIKWHDFEVVSEPSGKPDLKLSGKAKEQARLLGIHGVLLSLSHSGSTAVAVVIAEA